MPEPTSWTTHPTKYKFTSFEINLNYDLELISRETYDILEYLGDLGGFMEAITVLGGIIMAPFMAFTYNNMLASLLFMYKPSLNRKHWKKSDAYQSSNVVDTSKLMNSTKR